MNCQFLLSQIEMSAFVDIFGDISSLNWMLLLTRVVVTIPRQMVRQKRSIKYSKTCNVHMYLIDNCWDLYLPLLEFAYTSRPHRVTGLSPFPLGGVEINRIFIFSEVTVTLATFICGYVGCSPRNVHCRHLWMMATVKKTVTCGHSSQNRKIASSSWVFPRSRHGPNCETESTSV